MKLSKIGNLVVLCLIIVLFGVGLVDWRPQPVKIVNQYLTLIQKKDIENAYQMLYIQNSNSKVDLEEFRKRVDTDPLIEYVINGSSKINEKTYDVSTNINMDGWMTEHTFEVRKIEGNWKVVFD